MHKPIEQHVYLLRHGHRDDLALDPSLSHLGLSQARATGRRLANTGIEEVYASPFIRAVETAHVVALAVVCRVYIESGFAEHLNPLIFLESPKLCDAASLHRTYPTVDDRYEQHGLPIFPENEKEAYERAGKTLASVLATSEVKQLLIVGHGASLWGAFTRFFGRRVPFTSHHCGITHFIVHGTSASVVCVDDVSHLLPEDRTN